MVIISLSASGRLLPSEEQLWAGHGAALHVGGALQCQGVQHPRAVHPRHAAVRPRTGEERRGGIAHEMTCSSMLGGRSYLKDRLMWFGLAPLYEKTNSLKNYSAKSLVQTND